MTHQSEREFNYFLAGFGLAIALIVIGGVLGIVAVSLG